MLVVTGRRMGERSYRAFKERRRAQPRPEGGSTGGGNGIGSGGGDGGVEGGDDLTDDRLLKFNSASGILRRVRTACTDMGKATHFNVFAYGLNCFPYSVSRSTDVAAAVGPRHEGSVGTALDVLYFRETAHEGKCVSQESIRQSRRGKHSYLAGRMPFSFLIEL